MKARGADWLREFFILGDGVRIEGSQVSEARPGHYPILLGKGAWGGSGERWAIALRLFQHECCGMRASG